MAKKRKLHGSVKKVIKPVHPSDPEKVEIDIHEAEDLYRDIRIDNVVTNGDGVKDKLKQGEDVDIILEADPDGRKKP